MGKILKVTTGNGLSVHEYPESNTMEKLRGLIGGTCDIAEHVRPRRLYSELGVLYGAGLSACILVDEDGIAKDLPINFVGSYLYETDRHGWPILGDILVLGERNNGRGVSFCGITDRQLALLLPKFERLARLAKEGGGAHD